MRALQTLRHRLRSYVAAAVQAALDLLKRGSCDEDEHGGRDARLDLERADDIEIHHDIDASFRCLKDRGKRRSVIVADIFGVFQKLPLRDHLLKTRSGHEVVVDAILFAGADRPRGGGNRILHMLLLLHDAVQDGVFSDAGGAGDDKQLSLHVASSSVVFSSEYSASILDASVCGATEERITWSVSISKTAFVRRP